MIMLVLICCYVKIIELSHNKLIINHVCIIFTSRKRLPTSLYFNTRFHVASRKIVFKNYYYEILLMRANMLIEGDSRSG